MNKRSREKKPARNKWIALIVEAVAGSIIGGLLGLGIGLALAAIVPASGGGFQDLVAGIGGLVFGSVVGSTLGVLLAGRYLMYHYALWWAATAGAVIGVILAFALAPLLFINLSDQFPFIVAIFAGIFGAVGYGFATPKDS